MLIFFAMTGDAILLPVVLAGGVLLHIWTFITPNPSGMDRETTLLVQFLTIGGVMLLPMILRLGWEWRQTPDARWPVAPRIQAAALVLGLLLSLYSASWAVLAAQTHGATALDLSRSEVYGLRAISAGAVAAGVFMGQMLAVLLLWWKDDGQGDLWGVKGLTVLIPARGPLYYEIPRLHDPGWSAPLFDVEHREGLLWLWASDNHPLTLLTPQTAPEFLATWNWSEDNAGYDITVFGVDAGTLAAAQDPAAWDALVAAFCGTEAAPLRIVLFQECDGGLTTVIVPREPLPLVRRVLAAWGVREDLVRHRRHVRGQLNLRDIGTYVCRPVASSSATREQGDT